MIQNIQRWATGLSASLCVLASQAGVLPGPLVDTHWLAAHADEVQVVEVRGNAKSFTAQPEVSTDAKGKKTIDEIGGHIPGAVVIDAKKMRVERQIGDQKVKYMIPAAADFEKFVRTAGVNASKPLVLVPVGLDVADMNDALRMYWQFKVYGQDEMAVLNGGYSSWLLEGRPVETKAAAATGDWTVKADRTAQYMASSDDVAKAIKKHSATLVDSRDAPLFHGVVKRDYVFGYGHLAGAKLYSADLMFKSAGGSLKFMPAATYGALMKAQGINPAAAAITYCNSGHLSSGPWFVMSEMLGDKSVKLYDGSLHEWTLEKRELTGAVPLN